VWDDLAEALSIRPLVAYCHSDFGGFYAMMDRYQQARAELSTAVALYRSIAMSLCPLYGNDFHRFPPFLMHSRFLQPNVLEEDETLKVASLYGSVKHEWIR
jgi:hypothetical protein